MILATAASDVSAYIQQIVVGLIIVPAVAIDTFALERFTDSRKRRSALSLCFYAIPDGKLVTRFLELL